MATSTIKMQKVSFQWDIKDFVDCDLSNHQFIDSPKFSISESTWQSDWILRMVLSDTYNPHVVLFRLDSGATLVMTHSISFLKRNGYRYHTINWSELHQPIAYPDNLLGWLSIPKVNVSKFLDGGVLSVLCQMEIYRETEEIQVDIPEKHFQLYATSSIIPCREKSRKIKLNKRNSIKFSLPYGKLLVLCEGSMISDQGQSSIFVQIIDKTHPEITKIPVTINHHGGFFRTCYMDRSLLRTSWTSKDEATLEIFTGCTIESPPNAAAIDLTPCIPKMRNDYSQMFTKSDFGDVSIVVGENTIRAHKDLLSGRCPVFATMYSERWREQATQTITIHDFDFKTIRTMIEHIYYGGGDIEDSDENSVDLVQLLKAADMYQLDDLKSKCELLLCNRLDKEKVRCYFELANTYDLKCLKNATLHFANKD